MATNGGVEEDSAPPPKDDAFMSIDQADESFMEKQKHSWRETMKRLEDDARRKKKEWEKEVDRMRIEFLTLYPADKQWGSEDFVDDPMVYRRRGSTDILDTRKMKTLLSESPYSGCKYKLRFDMHPYDQESVKVNVHDDVIHVRAWREEEDKSGQTVRREYCRKIERPREVDSERISCFMTKDKVLIIEAVLPPNTLNFKKFASSPSHSHHSPHHSHHSHLSRHSRSPSHCHSPRSRSPSNASMAGTPSSWTHMRINTPVFLGPNSQRRMYMWVDVGTVFQAVDISIHVLKDTRLTVKARREERTSERLNKAKYSKEFELPERIDPYSLRAGLTSEGKVLIGALGKSHNAKVKDEAAKTLWEEINAKATPCNVLDLSTFPPSYPTNN